MLDFIYSFAGCGFLVCGIMAMLVLIIYEEDNDY
jgi:hypothetical protein